MRLRRSVTSILLGLLLGIGFCSILTAVIVLTQQQRLRLLLGFAAPTPAQATPAAGTPGPGNSQAGQPPTTPLPTSSANRCGGPEQMTIALLGVDERSDGHSYQVASRTDAISLVNIRFNAGQASMLSIPRDLYVALPNLEDVGIIQNRINTAYFYGEVYEVAGGGAAEFKQTVELNFGIRVDRYILINFGAFEAGVDALGGIDVDVPEAIYDGTFPTDDDTGTFIFSLPAGPQHMDGETALRYVRTRHQDSDYQRLERQQLVLLAIRNKLFSPEIIPQAPALLQTLGQLAQTDLLPEEITSLTCIGAQIDKAQVNAQAIDETMIIPWTTPNDAQVSIPNREALGPVIDTFLGR